MAGLAGLGSLPKQSVLVGAAAVVGALSVLVQAWRLSGYGTGLGEQLFESLASEVVHFALPAGYFRYVITARRGEPLASRLACAVAVAAAATANLRWRPDEFGLLAGVLAASYVLRCGRVPGPWSCTVLAAVLAGVLSCLVCDLGLVLQVVHWSLACALAAVFVSGQDRCRSWWLKLRAAGGGAPTESERKRGHSVLVGALGFVLGFFALPPLALGFLRFLLPLGEMEEAFELVAGFVGRDELRKLCTYLLLVTTWVQVSLGYLGIAFIRRGQERKNTLVYVGDGKETARNFSKFVGKYMLVVALPYMFQRTVMENVNGYVHGVFAREVERRLRLGSVFPRGPDGAVNPTLLAAVDGSKYTVESYTDAFNAIVDVCYSMVESKLFSFPKLLLLPGMLMQRPWLVVTVFPVSVGLDVGRARLITSLTKTLEGMGREIQELAQRRRKIEQHDVKHEELIRRGGASAFAEAHWRDISTDIEGRTLRFHALASLRAFINALYKQDFLMPGIEVVLAWLLESGHMTSVDIWVYARVVEDSINVLLTRFRMDAQLASMRTNMERVTDLSERLAAVRARGYAECTVDDKAEALQIRGLSFVRGEAHEVTIPDLALHAGRIYAVTGANGSGKSTLFGILASCGEGATVLPAALEIRALGQLVLPSGVIVEVGQQLYCPLFTKPINWMLQLFDAAEASTEEATAAEERIRELSARLAFHGKLGQDGQATGFSHDELHEEKQDWYGAMSGGQRVKAELIRKVFLRERCPGILLIDEAFAPLDPSSKTIVQGMLREFCKDSVVLVIYHTDAGPSKPCVTGEGSFFDANLHFENGTAELAAPC